jgi:anti-anti-sigma regulatory factor
MPSSFVIESAHGYPVFRVIGDVDFSIQADFEAALRSFDVTGASAAIVSFEDCTFFDSSIVGALMKYWRAPERVWDVVLLTKPGNPANRVFEVVGIDRVYPIEHSLQAAAARAAALAAARGADTAAPGASA